MASAQPERILEEEMVEAIAVATSVVRGAARAVVTGVVTTVVTSGVLGAVGENFLRKPSIVAAKLVLNADAARPIAQLASGGKRHRAPRWRGSCPQSCPRTA